MLSVIEVMANSRQVLQNCKELKKKSIPLSVGTDTRDLRAMF